MHNLHNYNGGEYILFCPVFNPPYKRLQYISTYGTSRSFFFIIVDKAVRFSFKLRQFYFWNKMSHLEMLLVV